MKKVHDNTKQHFKSTQNQEHSGSSRYLFLPLCRQQLKVKPEYQTRCLKLAQMFFKRKKKRLDKKK